MSEQSMPLPIPDFVDVDAAAVSAAEASALRFGGGWSIPVDVKVSEPTGKKKQRHARWSEAAIVQQAFRTVTKTGLLDAVLNVQSRTGQPNDSKRTYLHFYLNAAVMLGTADDATMKKHGGMTEQSLGAISTLLRATGMFPKSGGFKATLLNMLFPQLNEPGKKSPLEGKSMIVNAHATIEKKTVTTKDETTGESTTEVVEDTRVQADSFTPEETE